MLASHCPDFDSRWTQEHEIFNSREVTPKDGNKIIFNRRLVACYHKLRKTFGKFFRSYSELLSKFGDISFQEYLSKGISHPVFYGDLVYKLRRVKDTPNFILSGSKIVKRLRRRQYDPVIIERTILVIRSVSDVLRAQSRFVKFVGGEAAGRTPYIFYKPTLGRKYVSNRPYNEFITPATLI